ncbi:MAG: NUDIX hydrolase [Hymenobacteraceae bacterium]|nr:NUDIX hydrolase [Hymenobacteraceae bacterium]MDX5394585.1 NUDIX hydrolase [Hymenobacteraceae bacterium]MDX5510611.1 NUDIX hydrolase [Hymenobacteraceae bacterium]
MTKPQPWKILSSELALNEKWYKVRRDEVELPNGKGNTDYFVSLRPDGVLIFPVTEDGDVILVRQYKHASGQVLLELPGGAFDSENETAEGVAKRELLEETGYAATSLTHLSTLYDNPTKDTNRLHLFLAQNVKLIADQQLDLTEDIEVVKLPLEEVKEKVLNGEMKVTGSVALVFLALEKLKNKK